jgi:hypothetical protein
VEKLIEAIIELVSNCPPDKTEQLAESIRRLPGAQNTAQNTLSLTSWAANPSAKNALTKLVATWRGVDIPSAELAAMLTAASAAYHRKIISPSAAQTSSWQSRRWKLLRHVIHWLRVAWKPAHPAQSLVSTPS